MLATLIGSHLSREPTASPKYTKQWNWELTLATNFGSHGQMVTKFGGQILATKFGFVPDCSGECRRTSLMCSQHWFRQWLGAARQQAITWCQCWPKSMSPYIVIGTQWINGSGNDLSPVWCQVITWTKMSYCQFNELYKLIFCLHGTYATQGNQDEIWVQHFGSK